LNKEISAKDESSGLKAYMANMAKARLKRGIRVVMLANHIEKWKIDKSFAKIEYIMGERELWQGAIFQVVAFAKLRDARESENEVEIEHKARESGTPLWMIDMKQELKVLLGFRGKPSSRTRSSFMQSVARNSKRS
jgi:hypothetical protein